MVTTVQLTDLRPRYPPSVRSTPVQTRRGDVSARVRFCNDRIMEPQKRYVSVNEEGCRPPLIWIQAWPEEEENFRRLAAHMSSEQPMYAILCPTREQTSALRTVAGWTEFMQSELQTLPVPPPYDVVGWSFAGIVALELARSLGTNVRFTGLVDTWLPRNYHLLQRAVFVLNRYVLQSREKTRTRIRFFLKKEARAERRHFVRVWEFLVKKARRLVGASGEPSLQDVLLWRTFVSSRRYIVRPIEHPVTFFSAAETEQVQGVDCAWDWARLLVGGFKVVKLDGGHWTIWDDAFIRSFAKALERALGDP